jgi:hypothetical protein
MSENELQMLMNRLGSETALSTAEALAVAEAVLAIAQRESVACAIAGGLAVQLYGYARQTKDVDFIGERGLPLHVARYLTFGGESYDLRLDGKQFVVDWILRRDKYKRFYQLALAEADTLPNGWKIVSPEWLVVLKYIAGRPKDLLDLQWLLQRTGLVNRRKLRASLTQHLGAEGAEGYLLGLQRFYDLADLAAKRGDGDENESYRETIDEYPEYN